MGARLRVTLVCSECGGRNYQTTKARTDAAERIILKKFCPACNAHTMHKESK